MATAFNRNTFLYKITFTEETSVCVELELWMGVRANPLLISTFQLRFVCTNLIGLNDVLVHRLHNLHPKVGPNTTLITMVRRALALGYSTIALNTEVTKNQLASTNS